MWVSSEDTKNQRQVCIGAKVGKPGAFQISQPALTQKWMDCKTVIIFCKQSNNYHMLASKASFVFISLLSPQNNPLVRYYYLPFTEEDTEALRSKVTCHDQLDVAQSPARAWEASEGWTVAGVWQLTIWAVCFTDSPPKGVASRGVRSQRHGSENRLLDDHTCGLFFCLYDTDKLTNATWCLSMSLGTRWQQVRRQETNPGQESQFDKMDVVRMARAQKGILNKNDVQWHPQF